MKESLQPSFDVAFFLRQGFQRSVSHKACREIGQGSLSYRFLLGSALNSRSVIVFFPNVQLPSIQLACKWRRQDFIEGEEEVRLPIIMGESHIS